MISYLRGIVLEKSPTQAILDVNGVGYDIGITINCYEALPKSGEEIAIFTYLSVSENAMLLYGFASKDEREMFLQLISISGIGPKLGQVILSGITTTELKNAILTADVNRLKAISGIGKKTAERIVIELKDKLAKDGLSPISSEQGAGKPAAGSASEAVLALVSLGYKKAQAEAAVQKLLKSDPSLSIEDIIKRSLRQI
jgi:Holliday junction DNA helicase RuvA